MTELNTMIGCSSCNAELLYILESARKLREEEEAAAAGGGDIQSISKLVVTLILSCVQEVGWLGWGSAGGGKGGQ